ncbi:SKI/DACH domain-containing protein 1-like [Homarus americanus]|uniref:SKI/DACH domain-containing protein 1-like n=1 Tax=Homarus americanus TaxID=6706 RepID=UPI001C43F74D|nr:SKI/DACH domain-containing protein 1-like [Homarus americanus]XP_042236268.1 SKI/DACH domain-containing protein 1-like [Homarus americanus]
MSVGVLPGRRFFHWESASKPALNRCGYRSTSPHHPTAAAAVLPHLHHGHYPCPHHHHLRHHHRARRRHFTGESPPWPRRSSEVSPPSIASSWHTDTSSLLTSDSFSGGSSTLSADGTNITTDTLFVSHNALLSAARMSSTGAPRSTMEGNGGTSTAAAREVKQYLNRTLFPRPSSTLHGYASLYHRLKKLPGSHRKTRQQGKASPTSGSDSGSGGLRQDDQGGSDMDDVDIVEDKLHSPPRIEIHIYVPTAAATTAAATAPPHEEDSAIPF